MVQAYAALLPGGTAHAMNETESVAYAGTVEESGISDGRSVY